MPLKKRTSAGKAKAKPSGDAAAPDPPFSGADAAWKEVGVRVERIKKAGAWVAAGSEPTGIPGLSSLPSDWEGASVPISDVRPGSKASLVPSVGRIQNDPGMLRAARCWETSTGAVVAMAALQGRCCHWRTSPRPLTSTTLRRSRWPLFRRLWFCFRTRPEGWQLSLMSAVSSVFACHCASSFTCRGGFVCMSHVAQLCAFIWEWDRSLEAGDKARAALFTKRASAPRLRRLDKVSGPGSRDVFLC